MYIWGPGNIYFERRTCELVKLNNGKNLLFQAPVFSFHQESLCRCYDLCQKGSLILLSTPVGGLAHREAGSGQVGLTPRSPSSALAQADRNRTAGLFQQRGSGPSG